MRNIYCCTLIFTFTIIQVFCLSTMWNCDPNIRSMDLKTPRNVHLTAFYKRSFAFHTVKNRMPLIITQIIDGLARSKEDIGRDFGEEGQEELKGVIGELSKLKYEVQTNKPLRSLTSQASDVQFYNKYISDLRNGEGNVTFFNTIWLLSECYMYRRIREAFEITSKLQKYDPFRKQKETSYTQALPIITKLGELLLHILDKSKKATKDDFVTLLKLNLWGNRCDLSLSNGVVDENTDCLFNLDPLEPNILSDHSLKIWEAISSSSRSDVVDIIFDNAGYEVFTDLCLADYLISTQLATKVRLYVKTIPWFISDVMTDDFHWIIGQLKNSKNKILSNLGAKWNGYVRNSTWELIESDFWTLPVDYSFMKITNAPLYRKLGEAKMAIFKGDLNYRKLFGEKNWDPTTPVHVALQGFHPTHICTLRTIKADIVCGLAEGVAEKTEAVDEKWMETGSYGLIQFSDNVVPI